MRLFMFSWQTGHSTEAAFAVWMECGLPEWWLDFNDQAELSDYASVYHN